MKTSLKVTPVFLVCFILIFSISQAQDNEKTHSLTEGARALQFQISPQFRLGSFTGSTISYKRQTSEKTATRTGLSINSAFEERDDSENSLDVENQKKIDMNLSLSHTWMNYVHPEQDIKFYYGFGPMVSVGYMKSEGDIFLEVRVRTDLRTEKRYGFAGIGYTGVEWFVNPSISLHAEYGLSLGVDFRESERKIDSLSEQKTETNTTIFSLNSKGVAFGLSVYF